jgi:4-amino-4-deoxy-L-arabinose transferase-like glycosyltransferase
MMADLRAHRWQLGLLLLTVCLLALRFCHLSADFPVFHFYGQDGARYTDEGFYTGAALQHFTLGHAYLPGGWNPGIFMPVWPFLVGLVFHFTGISVVAARGLAVVCVWLSVLLAYAIARQYQSKTFACLTAFLIAANALGFFFGRLALLEPAFGMFLLLAIYLAGRVRPQNYALAILVGVVFVVATLTKTTGPFVLPAVLYPIWANNRHGNGSSQPDAWKLLATALATVIVLMGLAKILWFRHYPADAAIILGMSPLWQLENSPARLLRLFLRGTWIDPVLFPLALAAFIAAAVRLRSLWRNSLFMIAFLWEAGYAAFIVYHYDGPPRYFVTMIVPTIWLALIFLEWLWSANKRVATVVTACVAISVLWNVASIGDYLLHPRYTLVDASLKIKRMILAQHASGATSGELLIGRGAGEVSLLSGGLPAMDSDGAMPLAQKLDVYHPDWFMHWTNHPPARLTTAMSERTLVQQAYFSGLDPFDGAGIRLFRIFPKHVQ